MPRTITNIFNIPYQIIYNNNVTTSSASGCNISEFHVSADRLHGISKIDGGITRQ
jgi:hypothetical protein